MAKIVKIECCKQCPHCTYIGGGDYYCDLNNKTIYYCSFVDSKSYGINVNKDFDPDCPLEDEIIYKRKRKLNEEINN